MTLPSATLFPGALLPLHIFEPRYRRMLADALHSHRVFAVAMQKPGRTREIPSTVAGLGLIRVAVTKADTSSYLIVQGLTRVELAETVQRRPYRVQRIRPMPTLVHDPTHLTALTAKLRDLVAERLNQGQSPSHTLFKSIFALKGQPTLDALAAQSLQYFLKYLEQLDDPSQIADLVSCTLLPNAQERQAILETAELESRLHQVIQFLRAEIHRQKTA